MAVERVRMTLSASSAKKALMGTMASLTEISRQLRLEGGLAVWDSDASWARSLF